MVKQVISANVIPLVLGVVITSAGFLWVESRRLITREEAQQIAAETLAPYIVQVDKWDRKLDENTKAVNALTVELARLSERMASAEKRGE